MILGVDFSHWQGKPDCQKLKDNGVQFAFVKAGEMTSGGVAYYDDQHDRNIRELKRVGIFCGDYYYFHPKRGASKQARHYAQIYNNAKPDLPPVIDIEDTDSYLPKDVCSNLFAFIAGIEAKIGLTPIIYSRNAFIVNQIGDPDWGKDIRFWIARYSSKIGDLSLKIRENIVIWQYTDKLKLPGLTAMDGNYWLKSTEELEALTVKKPEASEPSEPLKPSEILVPTEPSVPPSPPAPSEPSEPIKPPEMPEPSEPAEPIKPSDFPEIPEPTEPPKPSEPVESASIWLGFYQFLRKIIERILSALK